MSRWLNPKILALALLLMVIQQTPKIQAAGLTTEALTQAALTVLTGGLFWGITGTFIYNRFYGKR